MTFSFRAADWFLLSPELFLTAAGLLVLGLAPALPKAKEDFLAFLSILCVVITAALTAFVAAAPARHVGPILGGMFVADNFALFFQFTILLSLLLTILASMRFVASAPYAGGEYYALVLLAGVGMMFMVSGDNLISIYVALETMALASYVLAGYFKGEVKSTEAALKYFVLGAFSSAVLLYGLSLIYGVAGQLGLPELGKLLAGVERTNLLLLGILLLLAGLLFKIAAVPFHFWTPDVYEGAPTPITAFMSVGPKAAGFAILIRVLMVAFPATYGKWLGLVWLSAALTMIVGNCVALVQSNIKRMLAYSSIAHAGYILVGVATRNQEGVAAILFYTLSYALMNIGAFTIVALVSRKGDQKTHIDDFAGLGFKQPGLAAALSLFLLSLAGIPLTAGFAGKFFIFRAALESHFIWLTVIGVINSAISVYYYLRVIVVMYMKEPADDWSPVALTPSAISVIALSVFGVLQFGIFPDLLINLARNSTIGFR